MNIYQVTWADGGTWDTYTDFVVICKSANEARNTHPSGDPDSWRYMEWCSRENIAQLTVTLLGKASPSAPKGVITASFHAG